MTQKLLSAEMKLYRAGTFPSTVVGNSTFDFWIDRVAALEAANEEWEQSFKLYEAADMRGIRMWQEATGGRHRIVPDKGRLVAWMLDKLDAVEDRLRNARILLGAAGTRDGWGEEVARFLEKEAHEP